MLRWPLARLTRIHEAVEMPLVIYGGTGFPDEIEILVRGRERMREEVERLIGLYLGELLKFWRQGIDYALFFKYNYIGRLIKPVGNRGVRRFGEQERGKRWRLLGRKSGLSVLKESAN